MTKQIISDKEGGFIYIYIINARMCNQRILKKYSY